ncbi:hypothetical protein CAPTEDRAFT_59371, partial [Capitella teleta]
YTHVYLFDALYYYQCYNNYIHMYIYLIDALYYYHCYNNYIHMYYLIVYIGFF